MLMLRPTPKVITFDCYGTLVQWHRTMRDAARSILSTHLGVMASEAHTASLADEIRARAVVHQQRTLYRSYTNGPRH